MSLEIPYCSLIKARDFPLLAPFPTPRWAYITPDSADLEPRLASEQGPSGKSTGRLRGKPKLFVVITIFYSGPVCPPRSLHGDISFSRVLDFRIWMIRSSRAKPSRPNFSEFPYSPLIMVIEKIHLCRDPPGRCGPPMTSHDVRSYKPFSPGPRMYSAFPQCDISISRSPTFRSGVFEVRDQIAVGRIFRNFCIPAF